MLSINSNFSSLIAQNSMKSSTNSLKQAIERMTTGYKINHAKDNAANYSIATNMSTQLNSYQVAEDNVAMGLDMVTTASDTLSLMQDKAERLRALIIQARNGTYGAQSLAAINTEAGAIISEINRIYTNSEYNGIKLFELANNAIVAQVSESVMTYATQASNTTIHLPKTKYDGFISNPKTYADSYVDALAAVSEATLTAGNEYKIARKEDLLALADFINAGNDTTNMSFYLAGDIDMESVTDWGAMETFSGTLDGNGYSIQNLSVSESIFDVSDSHSVLFNTMSTSAVVKNLCLEEVSIYLISGVGGICSESYGLIQNCYTTGEITAESMVLGGIVANNYGTIKECYSKCSLSGPICGVIAANNEGEIISCYANFDDASDAEGLVSMNSGTIENCYVEGSGSYPPGIALDNSGEVINCISAANGPLVTYNYGTIMNCKSTGNVAGGEDVGGIAGNNSGTITGCEVSGTVTGTNKVGGIVGYNTGTISNCSSTATVSGNSYVGGLVGQVKKTSGTLSISNSSTNAIVSGTNAESTGNFIGGIVNTTNGTSYGTVNIENCTMEPIDATAIGGCFNTSNIATGYDMSQMLAGIKSPSPPVGGSGGAAQPAGAIALQIGLYGDSSSQIGFDVSFSYDLSPLIDDITSDIALLTIDDFINNLSMQETKLGAVQNRLESALESISVNIENLTSSLSTIRDVDMAKESASYIQQQILQQASATLLSTANQNPAIALQLI